MYAGIDATIFKDLYFLKIQIEHCHAVRAAVVKIVKPHSDVKMWFPR